jgi:two-component system, chemotaxis family, chemotaxis protein CheY
MPGREHGVVLLVEDDDALREALVGALREGGFRAAAVGDGRAAMRWLGQHVRPAMILLDLWMPGTDGWQVRQEIETHPHLRDIPIIVITAAQDQKASLLNVRAVLEKPVTVPQLLETVARYI